MLLSGSLSPPEGREVEHNGDEQSIWASEMTATLVNSIDSSNFFPLVYIDYLMKNVGMLCNK